MRNFKMKKSSDKNILRNAKSYLSEIIMIDLGFGSNHPTFLSTSSSPQLRINWVVDLTPSYRGIKIASWGLYGNIWSLGWKTQFMDRFTLLTTLLQVRMTGCVSLQGHTCSALLLEEERMCMSWGLFTEGEEEVGTSLPGFFLSLTDLISHSIPLWGELNEEVRRTDGFFLCYFQKVEAPLVWIKVWIRGGGKSNSPLSLSLAAYHCRVLLFLRGKMARWLAGYTL